MATLKPGEILVVESAGGGGYGRPAERSAAALESDLADGYVTATAHRGPAPRKARRSKNAV